jgi:hypothetical protein
MGCVGQWIVSECVPLFAATGKWVILSGQHRFLAASAIADAAIADARRPPAFTERFRCKVVKENTSIIERQQLAGRLQAMDGNVMDMTLADRLQWLLKEDTHNREIAEAEGVAYNPTKTELLKNVYSKTGCRETVDGALV